MNPLPLHFQDVCLALMFVLFIPHMKGALRVGWVKAFMLWRPCLGPGSHLSTTPPQGCCAESASVLHVRAIHVQLPLVTSTATDSRDCEGATGFLYTFSLTALLTWSPGTDQT